MLRKILPLTDDYLKDCVELILFVFNSSPWNENWTFETASLLLQEITHTPGFMGFVTLRDEQVIGFLAGYSEQRDRTKCFYIKEICVHPEHQGQGIGSHLLQHLEQETSQLGCNLIYLITMRESQAESFYLKNCYKHSPRIIMRKVI
jgi:GNAT superfamily N-acetyltransferase